LSQISLVEVGQSVAVAADGVAAALHGTISSIGLLSSTSGSLTTFPVTVQLDAASPKLYDGVGADVRITAATARDVIAVSNSAIHTGLRGTHTVTAIRNGKSITVPVTLGVAGVSLTEVRTGLRVGDRVVLADYSTPVPTGTNSTTGTNRLARLFGGAGGNFPAIPQGR
jgi:multidrug efflux pump subunit AcrA (membrane-fusion protein)